MRLNLGLIIANQSLLGEYSFILATVYRVIVEHWDSSIQHRTLDFQRSTILNWKLFATVAQSCQIRTNLPNLISPASI